MTTRSLFRSILPAFIVIACAGNKSAEQIQEELQAINLNRGEITLCGSGADQFGSTSFSLSCSEKVKSDFNLAIALLHSFEYVEAEKVFAGVIDKDPECVMAYWGAAMSNFHQLWAPPSAAELEKGAKLVALGRSLIADKTSREAAYLDAVAAIYDDWQTLDYRTRLLKYEKASEEVYKRYPDDHEAAIFYSLALAAAADPADKTFKNQRKAGDILNAIFVSEPNHPGVAHYIIHNYDYPELAELGLPAAKKYAAIASASAHAQHMPSHIFIRLGLWEESIQSNTRSVEAAKCYAESTGIKGHWDEELHGLDYLTYAYLQKADDEKAWEQIAYLKTISEVFPVNFKDAYCFAAMPARYALERKDWASAAALKLEPADFPWEKFQWEKANVHFARFLGNIHTNNIANARTELSALETIHSNLMASNEKYQANLVLIQVKASQAWMALAEGDRQKALQLMTEAADMEEATAKHPVTPGEIIPARELLADMYATIGDHKNAIVQYDADLKKHPNRFNGIYGAAVAAEKSGDKTKATQYYQQLVALASSSSKERTQLQTAKTFLKNRK